MVQRTNFYRIPADWVKSRRTPSGSNCIYLGQPEQVFATLAKECGLNYLVWSFHPSRRQGHNASAPPR